MARKMKNTAATITPPAPRQTIHQHGTNWPAIVLVSVLCVPLALFLIWSFLAFLFYMMDFDTPGAQAASVIFGMLVISIIGLFCYLIGGYLITKWFDGKTQLQYAINDGLKTKQLTAQAGATDGRQFAEDSRLVKLVMLVMWHAYEFYEQYGEFGTNDAKPWSRRSVAALTIAGETKPVGETVINQKAKRFLEREGVIVADQINVDDYPNLDSVRELLQRRFNVPVKFYGRIESRGSLPDSEYGFPQELQK